MTNRLAAEKSPYLLQHADNPVDWYPWGEEALALARREDRPILVSIGYSACHWCHVMAHESFEDEGVAGLMNREFVNIKVDREERPDVDAIYMEAVQALTGQGGWPLNVFLTPDGRPFYGGTYFPPDRRHGMPAWSDVLQAIADAYREQRSDVLQNAEVLTRAIAGAQRRVGAQRELGRDITTRALEVISAELDWSRGGFGRAPKFPQPLALDLLLSLSRSQQPRAPLDFVLFTLEQMAAGGIHDQIGGGFHRYSVDDSWIVPHFEKMLYDNALLARVSLHAYQASGAGWCADIARGILDYLCRDLRAPEGGFYSSEDADSEGEEGKFYVWTPPELEEALSPDAARVAKLYYGVGDHGNFEGKTILTRAMPVEEVAGALNITPERAEGLLTEARSALLAARERRVRPGKDTKILSGWNALAIRALAEAGRILNRDDYLEAARGATRFLLDELRPGGRLVRSYREGPSAIPAFLEDYAFLAEALITLYETDWNLDYLAETRRLVEEMRQRFWDADEQTFYDTEASNDLIVRPRSLFDNPIPSGTSSAAFALLRLTALTGEQRYEELALSTFRAAADLLDRAPLAFAYLLSALDFYLSTPLQIAIAGDPAEETTRALAREVFERFLPAAVLAVGQDDEPALLAGRVQIDGEPTAYVCRHFSCRLPVTAPEALGEQLDRVMASPESSPAAS